MRAIILTILINLSCPAVSHSERSHLDFSDLEECEFHNMTGHCRELQNCSSLFSLLIREKGRPRPKILELLRLLHCGFNGKEPIVCCPETYAKRNHLYPNISRNRGEKSLSPRHCGRVNENDKIYEGSKAGLYDFPWMALIGYDTPQGLQHRCAGTLINRRYVLTAAHCVTKLSSLNPKSVRLGEHDLSSQVDCSAESDCAPPTRDFRIRRFIPHPDFRLKDLRNDIALIELAEDVNYSKSIQPICLPAGITHMRTTLSGKMATIAGWGATENGTYTSILRKAEIRIMSYERCRVAYECITPITEFQICAGGEGNVDTCSGDSGGPLKVIGMNSYNERAYIQYGLVSFGPRICGSPGKPGVYTKIAAYIDWIWKEMR